MTIDTSLPIARCLLFICVWLPATGAFAQTAPGTPHDPATATADESSNRRSAQGDETPATLNRTNPRATMRTFLVAVQDAAGDKPRRIDDAVACLDISELPKDDRMDQARLLARRLHAAIDRIGVKLDDIPTEAERGEYVFYKSKSQDATKPTPRIKLVATGDVGHWLFTANTLAALPAIEQSLAEKAPATKPAPPSKPDEPTVPAARRSARAIMSGFLMAMNADPPNLIDAILCLDPAGQDQQSWSVHGRDLALKLKNVMDKIELVVEVDVPDAPDGEPYVWHTSGTGNIVIARIDELSAYPKEWSFTPRPGEWRFTQQTLKTLDALYRSLEEEEIVSELKDAGVEEKLAFGMWLERQMPDSLREEFLRLALWKWAALGLLIVAGWMFKAVVAVIATALLGAWLRRGGIHIEPSVQRKALRSFGPLAMVLLWWLVVDGNYLQLPAEWLAVLLPVTKLLVGVVTVWVAYRLVDVLGGYIAADREVRLTAVDDVLIPLLRKILRVFVVLVAVLIVLDWVGYKPTTVLGALGIGGVALAFAAQDTLGNFFGSITVLFDRPFGIGDWIVIGDVEGTVERVGFRSTRVRTFYNSVITIPNSKMVNTQVDNYGARRYRRVRINLGIAYSTPPDTIDAFCEGIRELIRLHPYTRKDYYHVYFNNFADSSLNILLYAFFEVPEWATELRERHRLFVDIMRLAKRLGVEFAFPTRTVWLEHTAEDKRASTEAPGADERTDADAVGIAEAAKVFEEVYGTSPAPRVPVVIDSTPRSKRPPADSGDVAS